MNEKLEKTLSTIIDKSLELAEKTGEFVVEQGGELLEQFFMWHTASAIFFMVLGVLMLIAGLFSTRYFYKCIIEDGGGDSIYVLPMVLLGIAPSVGGIIMFFVNTYDLIYITVAPKLYLIDYFVGLN